MIFLLIVKKILDVMVFKPVAMAGVVNQYTVSDEWKLKPKNVLYRTHYIHKQLLNQFSHIQFISLFILVNFVGSGLFHEMHPFFLNNSFSMVYRIDSRVYN